MSLLSPELVKALGMTVMDALWQGAILLLIGFLFISLFKRTSAKLKYRVLVVVMLLFPICSVISFQNHFEPSLINEVSSGQTLNPQHADFAIAQSFSVGSTSSGSSPGWWESALSWMESNANLVAYFWLIGVIVFGVRLIGGLGYVRYIRKYSISIEAENWSSRLTKISEDFGLKVKVMLKESSRISSPIVIGFLKPIIVFPIGLIQGLPTEQVEAIIAHEIAHIKRLDYLMNLLLSAMQVVYFFHPAYWWLYRQAEQEREYHCDQMAIDYIGNKLTLIKALTSVQELRLPGLIPFLAFARKKNQLLERVLRIAEDRPKTNWLSGLISMFMILSAFALMSWQTRMSEPLDFKLLDIDHLEIQDLNPRNLQPVEQMPAYNDAEDEQHQIIVQPDTIPVKNRDSEEYQKAARTYKQTKLRLKTSDYFDGRQSEVQEIIQNVVQLLGNDTIEINAEIDEMVENFLKLQQQVHALGDSIKLLNEVGNATQKAESLLKLKEHFEQIQDQFSAADNRADLSRMEVAMKELQSLESFLRLNLDLSDDHQELMHRMLNTKITYQRRIDLAVKNKERLEFNRIEVEKRWNEQGLSVPMTTKFFSRDYFLTEYDVTQEHLDHEFYRFYRTYINIYPSDVILLDGEEVQLSKSSLIDQIGITNLSRVEKFRGKLAEAILERSLNPNPTLTRVMTKEYANSSVGQAEIRRAMDLHESLEPGPERTRLFNNAVISIDGEKRPDLTRADLFKEYGTRYTSFIIVGRELVWELYDRNYIGDADFLFLPLIDGKNTSVNDYHARLEQFNRKIESNPDNYSSEIKENVKYHLEAKKKSEDAKAAIDRLSKETDSYLIVVNSYIRKDLTLNDLKKMDVRDVMVMNRASAIPLYGNHLGDSAGAIVVETSTSQVIEYSNVMDPRSLKENQNPFTLPPYQSEIIEFDKALESTLKKDKLIDVGAENTIFLETTKLLVNYEEQPKRILKKYLKLYEKTLGYPLSKEITYYYNK